MSKKNQDKTPDELRDSLLSAALEHVAFDGWGNTTMKRTAEDLGVDVGIVDLAFPRGPIDMIDLQAQQADIAMLNAAKEIDIDSLKIREKITELVRLRINAELEHKEAVRRTVPFLALPQNHFAGMRILYRTVDLMWKAISDPSTDFNFYTKRMTLSAVYSSTFLFWLNDDSEENIDTWEFLDRRIENVMQFEKLKARVRNKDLKLPNIWRELGKMRYGA